MKRLVALLAVAATAAAVGLVTASAHTQRAAALRVFRVALAGENETPAGDPVATGAATIRVRSGRARICYSLVARDLSGRAVAAHIHRGAAGTAGPIVIPLKTPNASGKSSGCAKTSKSLVRAILAHPSVEPDQDRVQDGASGARASCSSPTSAASGTCKFHHAEVRRRHATPRTRSASARPSRWSSSNESARSGRAAWEPLTCHGAMP